MLVKYPNKIISCRISVLFKLLAVYYFSDVIKVIFVAEMNYFQPVFFNHWLPVGHVGATDDIVRIKCKKGPISYVNMRPINHAHVHLQQNVKRCKKQEEEKGSEQTFKALWWWSSGRVDLTHEDNNHSLQLVKSDRLGAYSEFNHFSPHIKADVMMFEEVYPACWIGFVFSKPRPDKFQINWAT